MALAVVIVSDFAALIVALNVGWELHAGAARRLVALRPIAGGSSTSDGPGGLLLASVGAGPEPVAPREADGVGRLPLPPPPPPAPPRRGRSPVIDATTDDVLPAPPPPPTAADVVRVEASVPPPPPPPLSPAVPTVSTVSTVVSATDAESDAIDLRSADARLAAAGSSAVAAVIDLGDVATIPPVPAVAGPSVSAEPVVAAPAELPLVTFAARRGVEARPTDGMPRQPDETVSGDGVVDLTDGADRASPSTAGRTGVEHRAAGVSADGAVDADAVDADAPRASGVPGADRAEDPDRATERELAAIGAAMTEDRPTVDAPAGIVPTAIVPAVESPISTPSDSSPPAVLIPPPPVPPRPVSPTMLGAVQPRLAAARRAAPPAADTRIPDVAYVPPPPPSPLPSPAAAASLGSLTSVAPTAPLGSPPPPASPPPPVSPAPTVGPAPIVAPGPPASPAPIVGPAPIVVPTSPMVGPPSPPPAERAWTPPPPPVPQAAPPAPLGAPALAGPPILAGPPALAGQPAGATVSPAEPPALAAGPDAFGPLPGPSAAAPPSIPVTTGPLASPSDRPTSDDAPSAVDHPAAAERETRSDRQPPPAPMSNAGALIDLTSTMPTVTPAPSRPTVHAVPPIPPTPSIPPKPPMPSATGPAPAPVPAAPAPTPVRPDVAAPVTAPPSPPSPTGLPAPVPTPPAPQPSAAVPEPSATVPSPPIAAVAANEGASRAGESGWLARRLIGELEGAAAADHQLVYRVVGGLPAAAVRRLSAGDHLVTDMIPIEIGVLREALAAGQAAPAAALAAVLVDSHTRRLGPTDGRTVAVAGLMIDANRQLDARVHDELLARNEQLVTTCRAVLGFGHPATLDAQRTLSRLRAEQARRTAFRTPPS